jgi:hypothetical protein
MQNYDPSTPPAGAENLHFMLNGETRRAPGPPVTCAQMAWEDVDKVSFTVLRYSHRQAWPEQHSPLHRLTSTRGKENRVIRNKKNKDMRERGWGTLSAKHWGKGILPRTVNKQARWAGEALAGARACTQQPGVGKLVREAEGGKLYRRGGKTHFPREL